MGRLCRLVTCSFAPSDLKYCSCSDDGTVRVWDFWRDSMEMELKGA